MHFSFLHTLQITLFSSFPSPMETRFKLSLSRIFHSSFSSCRSRNISDIIHKTSFIPPPDDSSFGQIQPLSPESVESVASSRDLLLPQRKISHQVPFPSAIPGSRTFPPSSPMMPFKPLTESLKKEKTTTKKKKKKKPRKQRTKETPFCPFSSSVAVGLNFGGTWWYSSEDEDEDDETDTLFSSKSRSSDSSVSHGRRKSRRRGRGRSRGSEMGVFPLTEKVKDSFAVVKKSSDPYNDFRTSMVEMIVEKQIFSGEDLEQLLQCFLSLNSHHHHNVILEVFTEIWEALFSDWGS